MIFMSCHVSIKHSYRTKKPTKKDQKRKRKTEQLCPQNDHIIFMRAPANNLISDIYNECTSSI